MRLARGTPHVTKFSLSERLLSRSRDQSPKRMYGEVLSDKPEEADVVEKTGPTDGTHT